MAADFAQERKWRMKSAKMLAGALVNYHNNQASRAARQLKVRVHALATAVCSNELEFTHSVFC